MSRRYSHDHLETTGGRRYNVRLIWHYDSAFTCYFGGKGWYDFVSEHNLDEGDSITVRPTKFCDTYEVAIHYHYRRHYRRRY